MMKPFMQNLLGKGSDTRGNVTVELALVMTVFILVILLGVDFSRMAIEKHRLEQFARAGTQYGLQSQGNATDLAGVEAAVNSAAGADAADITVNASNFCECPGSGSADCNDTCADGTPTELFLAVSVTKDYDYLFTLGTEVAGAVNLDGTSTVRVR